MSIATAKAYIPTKTADMSWAEYGEALKEASASYEDILQMEMPTPEIAAERGTPEWNTEWFAQLKHGEQRRSALMSYNARLIVALGEALRAAIPDFRSLDINYEGSGDSGERCDVTIYLDNPPRFDAQGERRATTEAEYKAYSTAQSEANKLIAGDLYDWLDETCWAIAYNQYPGFEINEGGFGSIRVEPTNEDEFASPLVMRITHTERVERTLDDVELA